MESELLGPIKITVTHFWNMHCLNIIIQAFTKTRYLEGNWGTLRAVLLKQQDSLFQQNVTLSEPTAIHCMSCNVDSAAINYSHRQARVTQAYFAYLPQMYCSRRKTLQVWRLCVAGVSLGHFQIIIALAGNRTPVSRVAGANSATEPPMLTGNGFPACDCINRHVGLFSECGKSSTSYVYAL